MSTKSKPAVKRAKVTMKKKTAKKAASAKTRKNYEAILKDLKEVWESGEKIEFIK